MIKAVPTLGTVAGGVAYRLVDATRTACVHVSTMIVFLRWTGRASIRTAFAQLTADRARHARPQPYQLSA